MREAIRKLREVMADEGIDWYLVPTADFHNSEYVADYFKCREFLSGFTGSNGTLLVGKNVALLWTDGRYFVQASSQLRGTEISLMKMGEPGVKKIKEYLRDNMLYGQTLGFDGRVFNAHYIEEILYEIGSDKRIEYTKDLCEAVWKNRPALVSSPAYVIGTEFTGDSYLNKIAIVREAMEEKKCQYFFLSKLDDIMWLFNIRGEDVAYNPVVLSFAFISKDDVYLFISPNALTDELSLYFKINNVVVKDYNEVYSFLEENFREDNNFNTVDSVEPNLLADLFQVNYCAYGLLKGKTNIIDCVNPTTLLKTVKNATEIENMREFFIRDSAAFVKFMYWIECRKNVLMQSISGGRYLKDERNNIISEASAAAYLDNLRAMIPGFKGLSFPTISAYGGNAAMMHYEAGRDGGSLLQCKGLYLVDSGGQYIGATTDLTRTIVMGELTSEEKRDYTLVCKGMLNLQNTHFMYGCTGRNLDIIARAPMWKYGSDYKCSTGHGVGCFLNVHEGPQTIRWRYVQGANETVLEPGMTITDEPGVYKADEYGIRIENTLLVVEDCTTADGKFLKFEPLNYVPIDMRGIDPDYLDSEDVIQLLEYQKEVYEKVSPYLTENEAKWLKSITIFDDESEESK